MFEIKSENYGDLKNCLNELLELLSNVDKIEINAKTYDIDFFLGSDYKMLRILLGQKASNALEGCLYCKCPMRSAPKKGDAWQIGETNTVLEPLIKFIPIEKTVIDLLHLLLRITDQLFKLLILKCIKIDKNDSENLNLRPNLNIFLDFLKNRCKISNPFYISTQTEDKIKLRSFNGNERLKIFEELYKPYYDVKAKRLKTRGFASLYTKNIDPPYDFDYEDMVWLDFYKILFQIKSFKNESNIPNYNPNQTSLEKLREDLKTWLQNYLLINEKNRNSNTISPYIHIFVYHIPQLIEIHHDLNVFNTQGLEKLNDFSTQYYHSCTNKQNENKEYLNQLFKKQNRMEFYYLNGKIDEIQHNLIDEDEEFIGENDDN